MTWIYDLTRDVLTITYGHPDRHVARTVGSGDAVLYVDDRGDAIRVEVIRAGQRHSPEFLRSLANHDGDSMTLAAAAERFGVKAYALREEILSGGMPASRAEQSWQIGRPALDVYREILEVRRAADRSLRPGQSTTGPDQSPTGIDGRRR